ncbi:hypothetical protein MSVAZ_2824 [Methanosarcina vacuolata Z-761]|uniref:Glycosyltransferase RgtA/B/C/D-like domain-containing protein n=1 Tax=Methanosarcina vacuolata Z-761 TaxID=1434123 RepID=A0A0E3Q866_9EURY|nr:hypothetical protein MSVAZ_2824 [Methanosarcina vacuolata Z-761]
MSLAAESRTIIMTNKNISIANLFLYIKHTIYVYPMLIGIVILYLSYFPGIGQYGMGFAFFLGSVFYYILKNNMYVEVTPSSNSTSKNYKLLLILNIVFFVSFSLSLLVLHQSIYYRSVSYFSLITISFFSIFMEIIQRNYSRCSYFLILKIILVSLSLRIGRLFNYPTIPGSDTHFHLNIVELIVQNGTVPSYYIANKYSFSCLLHILMAIDNIILSVNLKNLLFCSIVLSTTIIVSLFIYCIVNKMYNTQIALISVLFINISDMFFNLTVTNINPGSIVYCFFIMILFCIIQQKNRPTYSSFVVLMIFCMILSHQLSTFCVFYILFSLLLGIIFHNIYFTKILKINLIDREVHLYYPTLTLFFVSMILHWILIGGTQTSGSFFDQIIYRLDSTIASMFHEYVSEASVPTNNYETFFSTFNVYSNILYNLGSNLLLMLAIIGILLIIDSKLKSQFNFSYISAAFTLFCLIYAGTYVGLGYLLIPHRFLPFFQLFWVIFASYSTYIIYNTTSQKWRKLSLMGIVIFLIFFMITAPYLNNGEAIYSTDMVSRNQLIYSELKSLEWSNYFLENQTVYCDSAVTQLPISTVDFLNISTYQIMNLDLNSNYLPKNILIRQYVIDNPNLNIGGTFGTIHNHNYQEKLIKIFHEYNLIYSNNCAKVYQTGCLKTASNCTFGS